MWREVIYVLLLIFLSWVVFSGYAGESKICMGVSCAETGPAAKLGQAYLRGSVAYFKKIDSEGGIKGRKIEWTVLDDTYIEAKTIANTKRLLDNGVDVLAGCVGTPTARAVLNWIEKDNIQVPSFFLLTDSAILKKTVFANIYSICPFYKDEIQLMVDYFILHGYTRFGVFYQNDTFGYSGRDALRDVLGDYDLLPVYEGFYEKKGLRMEKAVKDILEKRPDVVILVGTAPPAIKFMDQVFSKMGRSAPIFVCFSFVSADELSEFKDIGKLKVFASQVVPLPKAEINLPAVQEFREAMQKFFPGKPLSFVSMEGFLAAKLLCQIIKRADSLSASTIRMAAERVESYDISVGSILRFNSLNHRVWIPLSLYKWTPQGWQMLVRRRFALEIPDEEKAVVNVTVDSVVGSDKV